MQSNVEVAADQFLSLTVCTITLPKAGTLTSAHNAFVSSVPQVLSLGVLGGATACPSGARVKD